MLHLLVYHSPYVGFITEYYIMISKYVQDWSHLKPAQWYTILKLQVMLSYAVEFTILTAFRDDAGFRKVPAKFHDVSSLCSETATIKRSMSFFNQLPCCGYSNF